MSKERYKPKAPFLTGAVVGGVEIMITFPFEFLKTEMQLLNDRSTRSPLASSSDNFVSIFRSTTNRYGIRGLYRGESMNLIRQSVSYRILQYRTGTLAFFLLSAICCPIFNIRVLLACC